MMPMLFIEDLPADVYRRLQKSAELNQLTMPAEATRLLGAVLSNGSETSSVPAIADRLEESEPVAAWPEESRLPDPPFLTEEIPAPFSLPMPDNYTLVETVQGEEWLPDPIE
jgi:hypothetical protein